MSTVATDLQHAVEDAAAHLYVWALKDIPQDLRDALSAARARETSVPGKRVLETIHRNVNVADSEKNLVCQDTGIAVYHCRVGEHFPLHPTRIYEGLRDGNRARDGRASAALERRAHDHAREHGPNIGHRLPIVHWEFIADWDGLDVKCVPKGSGSENMSFLKMCVPADGVKGVKQFVLESIVGAGGKPCPPGIVGVGIGGSADYAMYLAKEAIMRPIGTRNADPHVAQLEDELFGLLNETGIGPMGLGGDVTVLQCHIEHADTHMTLNPVAVQLPVLGGAPCVRPRRARRRHRLRPGVLMVTSRPLLRSRRSRAAAASSPSIRDGCGQIVAKLRHFQGFWRDRIGSEGGGCEPHPGGGPGTSRRSRPGLEGRGLVGTGGRAMAVHEVTFPITDPARRS